MAIAGASKESLRLDQVESSRLLVWAILISMSFHLLILGGYYAGEKLNLWQELHWPAWLRPVQKLVEALKKKEERAAQPPVSREPPLMFIDVSAAQASAEPPADAKFYSDKNALAANPKADQEMEVPKIEGNQTQIAKTEDVPRQKEKLPPAPLQPSLPAPVAPEPQEELKAKPKEPPGDLAMAKPEPATKKMDDGQETQSRPRTIREALALHPETRLAGEKMKQEGGVRRRAQIASFDTKATPFGAYDAELIEVIQDHWYNLLDARDYASEGRGKVQLQFVLHQDGRITDMKVVENTVTEVLAYLCEKAVLDPAPFRAWPSDMRRMMGETRPIQFTFYYN